jgi:hypothetical protein
MTHLRRDVKSIRRRVGTLDSYRHQSLPQPPHACAMAKTRRRRIGIGSNHVPQRRAASCNRRICDRATNRRAMSNAVDSRGTCPLMRVPPSPNSQRICTGPTFATVAPTLWNGDPWRPTAAFALSKSMRIVRCMMAQSNFQWGFTQVVVQIDQIWSRVNAINAINAICCVMWDESGSRR